MKAEQKIVEWEDRFSVGVPLVDNQHKHLIDMTNQLHNACLLSDDTAKEQYKKTVREAVAYVKHHFSTEEQIMEKTAYPGLVDHKKIHTEFAQEVLRNALFFDDGKKYIPNQFVRFLRDWVLTHVALIDNSLGNFLIDLQNRGKLFLITLDVKSQENQENEEFFFI